MEEVLIDTNILANFFLKTDLTNTARDIVKKVLISYRPVVFINIVEETIYILVREELRSRGIEKFYDQKEFIAKNGYRDLFLYRKFIEFLNTFDIAVKQNTFRINEFINIMEKYNLLPNDALIVATCKFHGINKITTLDEDFKKVDFLRVFQ